MITGGSLFQPGERRARPSGAMAEASGGRAVPPPCLSPGDYRARLGDIDLFYRVLGSGLPMLLLHGGFETADYWQPALAAPLSERFTTIALDSRGQGRTTGTKAPITYARMARDVVALLDRLEIGAAHMVGHSDGGCVALHLLKQFEERVASATLIGTPFNIGNYPPAVFARLQKFIADARCGAAMREREATYRTMAPNPDYWPTLLQLLGDTWLTEPQFTVTDLATISRPVLVIDAGADQFLPSAVFHALAEALPNARLYSLPQGTHNVALEYARELVEAMVKFIGNA